jgi:hypothetical protein
LRRRATQPTNALSPRRPPRCRRTDMRPRPPRCTRRRRAPAPLAPSPSSFTTPGCAAIASVAMPMSSLYSGVTHRPCAADHELAPHSRKTSWSGLDSTSQTARSRTPLVPRRTAGAGRFAAAWHHRTGRCPDRHRAAFAVHSAGHGERNAVQPLLVAGELGDAVRAAASVRRRHHSGDVRLGRLHRRESPTISARPEPRQHELNGGPVSVFRVLHADRSLVSFGDRTHDR